MMRTIRTATVIDEEGIEHTMQLVEHDEEARVYFTVDFGSGLTTHEHLTRETAEEIFDRTAELSK